MKKCFALALLLLFSVFAAGCDCFADDEAGGDDTLYIYSWGDYLDEDVIAQFEEETGITVVLDEFDTNESMYPRVKEGATSYDLICPSDYMIQKMEQNDLLQPLDWSKLPKTVEHLGKDYLQQAETYDPGNKYSVPYCWGTVGIMYNKTMVDEPVDSWTILFDPRYKGEILMQDSARDAFMIPLRLMNVSMNTKDETLLASARDMLIAQKPLVQAYGVDDIRDKLAGGEAALGVIFSGEAINLMEANEDLAFCPAPKEGTNLWMDGWVIPKNAQHVDNAHKFIDFLSRPEIAAKNFEALGYSTPNTGVQALVEEDMDDDELANAFPSPEVYLGQETYQYLGEAMDKLYTKLWLQVKVE